MTESPHQLGPHSTFEDILDAIEDTTRRHGLTWRLSLGQILLDAFFDGDIAAYGNRSPGKEHRFLDFFGQCREDLTRYGVGEQSARNCIKAWAVVQTLPPSLSASLFFTQVLLLTRLADPTQRTIVAQAAVQQNWTVRRLQGAVDAVRAGVDPQQLTAPGATMPEAPRAPALPPGRLLTQAEKWVDDLDAWTVQWQQVRPEKLPKAQRERLRAAVTALQTRAAALAAELDGA